MPFEAICIAGTALLNELKNWTWKLSALSRENGAPEMVGSIGSRNAVASNDQITAAISQAVYQAVREANRDTQNSGSRNSEMTVKIVPDKNSFVKVAVDGINDTTRRTGKSPLH